MTAKPGPAGDGGVPLTEAARRLGVHYMTAYRYVRSGRLSAERRGGQWMVPVEALEAFPGGEPAGRPGRPPQAGAGRGAAATPAQVNRLADRLVAGDHNGAWALVRDRMERGQAPSALHLTLLGPALAQVGDRWAAGTISVADEHRATVVATRLLGRLAAAGGRRGATRGTLVLTAAPGDRHALPTALVAEVLRAEGFDVVDLGADTPADDLADLALRTDRLLGVGVCATFPPDDVTVAAVARAAGRIRAATGAPVLVGGAAAGSVPADRWHADAVSDDTDGSLAWFRALGRPTPATSEEPA